MTYGKMLFFVFVSIFFTTTAGYSSEASFLGTYRHQQFQKYWFSGKGEISRFSLEQARYGEIHKGDAILVYLQMNLRDNAFQVTSHSYFEKEGDKRFRLRKILPEDARLTRIRIAPATLPQGEFLLIPSATCSRFLHRPLKPVRVIGKLIENGNKSLEGVPLADYEVDFKEEQRTIRIFLKESFRTVFNSGKTPIPVGPGRLQRR
jgi:hypothetical protein